MAVQDIREALITASMLIGNANAILTHLQREKLISAINDNLTPLIQDESQFTDVAPYLFGSDFVKQAKEYLDQVGALKSTLIDIEREELYDKRPLFCEGPPRRGNRPEEGAEDPSIKSKCTNREQGTSGGHFNPSTEQYTHNSQCKNAMSKYKCHSVSDSCNGDNTPNHTSKSSGSAGTLSIKLGKSNKGPVGPKYSEGVRNRIFIKTPSNPKTLPCPTKPDPTGVGIPRDQRHDLKRGSDRVTDPTSGQACFWCQRWRPETGDKFEKVKLFHKCPTFQDGRHSHTQKPSPKGRLASKDRPERCILFCPDKQKAKEISVFPIQGQVLPVQLSPFWPGLSPMGLYQDLKADSSSRSGAGDTVDSLHRRHSPDGRNRGESQRSSIGSDIPTTVPRFHCKHGKDGTGSVSIPRIFEFHGRYYQDGTEPSSSKNKDSGGVPTDIRGGACNSPHPLQIDWQNECHKPVIPPAPLFYRSLQMDLTMALRRADQDYETHLNLSPDSREELIWWDTQMIKWNGRTVLATEPDLTIESDASSQGWGASCQGTSTGGPWSPLEEKWHINCLELLAATLALKTFVKNTKGLSVLLKIRQHNSSCLHQQPRGNYIQGFDSSNQRFVDVVSREEHSHISTIPTWSNEPGGRHGIKIHEGSIRLESGSFRFSENQQEVWSSGSGPVCNQINQPVPSLLQLAARSICRSNRRLSPGLDNSERFRQPTLEPSTESASKNTESRGRSNSGSPSMEISAMVSPPTVITSRLATPATQAGHGNRVSPNNAPTSRVEHLRERLDEQGLSSQATDLILNSWRTKTNKSYDSLFGRWNRWCTERGSNPFSGPVSEVANFLATLYQEGSTSTTQSMHIDQPYHQCMKRLMEYQ